MDDRQTQRILRWLEIEDEEVVGGEEDDEENVDYPDQVSDHDTESEQEGEEDDHHEMANPSDISNSDEDDTPLANLSSRCFVVKKKQRDGSYTIICKWKKTPYPQGVRTRRHNIVTEPSGPQDAAREVSSPYESWSLFMDIEMLQHIVTCTNIKITSMQINYERERDCGITNVIELRALFGVMYIIGLHKSSHTCIDDIWITDGTGLDFCRAVMSKQRFQFLLRALRFDDIHTRTERYVTDKLAPIRWVYESFVNNCEKYYTNTECVTIDEMLESFRGSCRFRQYMPSKPAKYGIKLFSLVDAASFYTKKLEIYVGKQPEGPFYQDTSTKSVVQRLIAPISGTGRNVTMDNWFTSVTLADDLLRDHNLTLVGTLRKNKPEIPNEFKNKNMQEHKTTFGFQPTKTLLSYCSKKNKFVIMLSTMHHSGVVDDTSDKKLPEIIEFYNKTKGGVDVVDKLIGTYSVARVCRRWPLRLLFTFLDVGALNAHIILDTVNTANKFQRKVFLKTLAFELCRQALQSRATITTLPRDLKQCIRRFTPPFQDMSTNDTGLVPMRKRCIHCPRRTDRKFKSICYFCKGNICPNHTKAICTDCVQKND